MLKSPLPVPYLEFVRYCFLSVVSGRELHFQILKKITNFNQNLKASREGQHLAESDATKIFRKDGFV